MSSAIKRKHTKVNAVDEIKRHAETRGVTIFLDHNEDALPGGHTYEFDKTNKILTINAFLLEQTDKPLLLELIRKVYKDGELTWKYSKSEALANYEKYRKENKYDSILAFFFKLLSPADYAALKMSFFVRELSQNGNPIHTYKMDIRDRFGERGANICNLCSAGYFENELKSIYDNGTVDDFQKYYRLVVEQKARALFVHGGMTSEDLKEEISQMVDKAIKYHMDDFRIHGIGKANLETIKVVVDEITKESPNFRVEQKYSDSRSVEYIVSIIR